MPNKAISLRHVEGAGDPDDTRAGDLDRLAQAIRGFAMGGPGWSSRDGVIVQIERSLGEAAAPLGAGPSEYGRPTRHREAC